MVIPYYEPDDSQITRDVGYQPDNGQATQQLLQSGKEALSTFQETLETEEYNTLYNSMARDLNTFENDLAKRQDYQNFDQSFAEKFDQVRAQYAGQAQSPRVRQLLNEDIEKLQTTKQDYMQKLRDQKQSESVRANLADNLLNLENLYSDAKDERERLMYSNRANAAIDAAFAGGHIDAEQRQKETFGFKNGVDLTKAQRDLSANPGKFNSKDYKNLTPDQRLRLDDMKQSALDKIRKERETAAREVMNGRYTDPANSAIKYAQLQGEDIMDPKTGQPDYGRLMAIQDELGIPKNQQAVLTNSQAKEISFRLNGVKNEGEYKVFLDELAQTYPTPLQNTVLKDVVNRGDVSPTIRTVMFMDPVRDRESLTALFDYNKNDAKEMKEAVTQRLALNDEQYSDLEKAVNKNMQQFMDISIMNRKPVSDLEGYRQSAINIASQLYLQGNDLEDAAKRATRFIDDAYEPMDTYLVPKDFNVNTDVLDQYLKDQKKQLVDYIKRTGDVTLPPTFDVPGGKEGYMSALGTSDAMWINTADNRGVILTLGGLTPVTSKAGATFVMQFDDLPIDYGITQVRGNDLFGARLERKDIYKDKQSAQ